MRVNTYTLFHKYGQISTKFKVVLIESGKANIPLNGREALSNRILGRVHVGFGKCFQKAAKANARRTVDVAPATFSLIFAPA